MFFKQKLDKIHRLYIFFMTLIKDLCEKIYKKCLQSKKAVVYKSDS